MEGKASPFRIYASLNFSVPLIPIPKAPQSLFLLLIFRVLLNNSRGSDSLVFEVL